MRTCLSSLLTLCLFALLSACNGGSGGGNSSTLVSSTTPTGDNVVAISVNPGLTGSVNRAFTTVTVCVPGTSQCQTIDNIAIDTGSMGLRVLASAIGSMSLPTQTSISNHPLAECIQFVDLTHVWGPVKLADVKIGGKTANSLPIQVVGDSSVGTEPSTCASGNSAANMDTVAEMGANGILGVGLFQQDCGNYCSLYTTNNVYFDCPTTTCTQTAATLASQVHNPIDFFGSDNNGVVIDLPSVPASGSASVNGWMIFGINTRDNNALGSATAHTTSAVGYVGTNYKGSYYPQSFIDSGSNGLFFPDASIPQCTTAVGFYCPPNTLQLTGTIVGRNNVSTDIVFGVTNAEALNGSLFAFNNLAGPYSAGFDWGLPFFFGRKVFTALETNLEGPYIAF